MKNYLFGVLTGAVFMLVLVLMFLAFRFFKERDREQIELWERQRDVQFLEEDVRNRDADDFLDLPGVRGAAESAWGLFRRKRDEILQRLGSDEDN